MYLSPYRSIVAERAETVGRPRLDGKQMERLRQDLRRQLLEVRDVADEDAAAIRAEHQVVLARMDRQIVHRHRRQVGFEPRPVPPASIETQTPMVVADDQEVARSSDPARRR